MSERASLKIVQIAVDVGDGDYCAISLTQERRDLLIGFIKALSEGPIKLVRLIATSSAHWTRPSA
ncbi:hypothetical protein GR702_17475 [Novosphingobium sp. FGD1]|uniref:Uncharacterized protein n=1 Tax=Novosphingobium silvae TaxID=2692619 RepID=A0A7X4GKT8_9SPHN|nr:hypothetical protein [Novosphingobium silvae]MYL99557.1 hypothetical protein [Novosphingobium silvae]